MPNELKRNAVELTDHDPEWEKFAVQKIGQLWSVFGSSAKDIQHIGSTAIRGIKAKPIIDIMIGVESFDVLTDELFSKLDEIDVYKSVQQPLSGIILGGVRKNSKFPVNLHFVEIGSIQWKNHIDFHDYMNCFPDKSAAYERIKLKSAALYPNDRDAYSKEKAPFIKEMLCEAELWARLRDIPGYDTFIKIDPVTKGWSGDQKYYVETVHGRRMLLRVSDISEIDRKKAEYEMMERVYRIGVLTSEPLSFGLCDDSKSCYSLSGWLDGEDAENALPFMSETEQYVLGLKAGETLRKIQTLPAPEDAEPWGERFQQKVHGWINFYSGYKLKSKNTEFMIKYLYDNLYLVDNRPQSFCHGDFWIGNLVISPDGDIGVIDFNYYHLAHGDPGQS